MQVHRFLMSVCLLFVSTSSLSGAELGDVNSDGTEVTEKADDTGTLYGSVSAQTVAGLLKDAGFEVEERAIRLEEPIKVVGEHEVPIHVHGEHYASVQLVVQAST